MAEEGAALAGGNLRKCFTGRPAGELGFLGGAGAGGQLNRGEGKIGEHTSGTGRVT